MKSKFLLPLLTASVMLCSFSACSDDSSDPVTPPSIGNDPENPLPGDTSTIVPPNPDVPGVGDSSTVVPPVPSDTSTIVPPNPDVPGVGDSSIVTPPASGDSSTVVPPDPTPTPTPDTPVIVPPEGMEPIAVKIENTFPKNESVGDRDPNATFYGAELTGVDQFTYGRFEARMKMVSIPGSVSSMFLYYDPSYLLDDEPWNEIDIEVLGKNPGEWQSNLITREPNVENPDGTIKKNSKQTSEFLTGFGFDATKDFHLYAMIWTPEYISWEIDSVEVRRDVIGKTTPNLKKQPKHDQVAFMTEQQSLRFNLWSAKSGAWVGKFTGAELADGPQEQVIDYVRVYKYDTATKTFSLDWQDDFEGSELSDHWSAGSWEMENVTLSPNNVVVEDGYCKLRMSREEN